jgi:hypothetical protein
VSGSYVPVRAIGRHGLRHWIYREAGQPVTGRPALCGLAPARGWVTDPDHWTRDCTTCERKADEE